MSDVTEVIEALHFAAHKHRFQPRKDEAKTPYINHVIAVVHTLATVGEITEPVTLVAAALHDTVEDTKTSSQELEDRFGPEVRRVVQEVTDDKSLPKAERKKLQIEHAARASSRAKMIKLADKTSNLRAIVQSPPVGWSLERQREYFEWATAVVAGCRGINPRLEESFDRAYRAGAENLARREE